MPWPKNSIARLPRPSPTIGQHHLVDFLGQDFGAGPARRRLQEKVGSEAHLRPRALANCLGLRCSRRLPDLAEVRQDLLAEQLDAPPYGARREEPRPEDQVQHAHARLRVERLDLVNDHVGRPSEQQFAPFSSPRSGWMAQLANGLTPETRITDSALLAVDVPTLITASMLTLNSQALRPRLDIGRSPFMCCSGVEATSAAPPRASRVPFSFPEGDSFGT